MNKSIIEVSPLAAWLEPKIVVPAIGVILASVIVPMLLHYLKARREKENKILELRIKVYSEYFKKFEVAAESVGVDYEKFSKVTLKDAFRELLEENSSPNSIIKFQDTVGKFPFQIQESYRKATEEITSLKILGSDRLFHLTSEFELLQTEILNMSSKWLAEMQLTLLNPDMETPIAKELKLKGELAKRLKDDIIKQMRVELKNGR
ncbi:hypothetical protein [Klebsiella variicola]|uniref:hypothetical protein n=1 Tax=Klebsiella variicola TaxID=244366 RepID=UPI001E358DE3|nr:hypothetical protein [Klebsiella variicola]MCE0246994.1 hypothetical protein [Klebsiella variicola subsp. variicola]